MVERTAKCQNIVGTAKHLALRKRRSVPVLQRLREWRENVSKLFEPKSAMGAALRCMKNQWSRLTTFLDDALIPIHNNASEEALRIVALARKNSLFFGNEEAGRRFTVLYSLIATCERHDVNPELYKTGDCPTHGSGRRGPPNRPPLTAPSRSQACCREGTVEARRQSGLPLIPQERSLIEISQRKRTPFRIHL